MSNLGILIKNNINIALGKMKGKQNRKSTVTALIFVVIFALFIYGVYFLQNYMIMSDMVIQKMGELGIYNSISTTIMILLILSISNNLNGKTTTNDSELLLSLPIKKSDIILSKTVSKYAFDLLFTILLFSPNFILQLVMVEYSTLTLIYGLVIMLILPLFSTGLSYICDFILAYSFNKFKNSGILKSIFSFVIFFIIFTFIMVQSYSMPKAEISSITTFMQEKPIINFIYDFIVNHKLLNFLLILLVCLVIFTVGVLLKIKSFGKNVSGYKSKNKVLSFSNNGLFASLFKKEAKYYFSTPPYLMNTALGPIFIILIGILVCIFPLETISNYLGGGLPQVLMVLIISFVMLFMISMSCTTCSSISLEGKQFWILKSTPINVKKLFNVKIFFNILIVVPFILISALLITIVSNLSFVQFLLLTILPILLSFIMATGGLLINLWLPKLDFKEEIEVVKQSLAMLVTMLAGYLMTAIPIILLFATSLPILLSYAICVVIYILVLIAIVCFLYTVGVKRFYTIK